MSNTLAIVGICFGIGCGLGLIFWPWLIAKIEDRYFEGDEP